MAMPFHQTVRLGTYVLKQKVLRKDKYPLLVELEPLFACNLKCAGCGKIQQPHTLLKQRMPVEQEWAPSRRAAPRWCRSPAASR